MTDEKQNSKINYIVAEPTLPHETSFSLTVDESGYMLLCLDRENKSTTRIAIFLENDDKSLINVPLLEKDGEGVMLLTHGETRAIKIMIDRKDISPFNREHPDLKSAETFYAMARINDKVPLVTSYDGEMNANVELFSLPRDQPPIPEHADFATALGMNPMKTIELQGLYRFPDYESKDPQFQALHLSEANNNTITIRVYQPYEYNIRGTKEGQPIAATGAIEIMPEGSMYALEAVVYIGMVFVD